MDSPRVAAFAGGGRLSRWIGERERVLYEAIPLAGLVLALTVPLDLAFERNRSREKDAKKSDAEIARRHREQAGLEYTAFRNWTVDASGALPDTVAAAKALAWQYISRNEGRGGLGRGSFPGDDELRAGRSTEVVSG